MLVLAVVVVRVVALVDQGIILFAVGAGGAPIHIVGDLGIRQQAARILLDAIGLAHRPGAEGRFGIALRLLAGAVFAHHGIAGEDLHVFAALGLIDRQLGMKIPVDGRLDADAVFAAALLGDGLAEQGLPDLLLGNDVLVALIFGGQLLHRHGGIRQLLQGRIGLRQVALGLGELALAFLQPGLERIPLRLHVGQLPLQLGKLRLELLGFRLRRRCLLLCRLGGFSACFGVRAGGEAQHPGQNDPRRKKCFQRFLFHAPSLPDITRFS